MDLNQARCINCIAQMVDSHYNINRQQMHMNITETEAQSNNCMAVLCPSQCLGKLRRDQEEETKTLSYDQQQRKVQKITRSALGKLLPKVQVHQHGDGKLCVCALSRLSTSV